MEHNNRDFKGVWIPREVWLDERLNPLEKVILVEIDSLDSSDVGCFASNEHLANFCQCSATKVSNTITKLRQMGYLNIISTDGRNRYIKSNLTKNVSEPYKNCKADLQKMQHSNTKSNKESINKQKFISLPLIDSTDYDIYTEDIETYKELYSSIDVEQEIRNMKGWLFSNTHRRKTRRGIKSFINNWLSNSNKAALEKEKASKQTNEYYQEFKVFQFDEYGNLLDE